jgi:hypothetical protein
MIRYIAVIVALAFCLTGLAEDAPLVLGKKQEFVVNEPEKPTRGVDFLGVINDMPTTGKGYQVALPAKFKKGEPLLVSAKLKDSTRKILVILRDRTGAVMATTKWQIGSCSLKWTEMPYTGDYTIEVVSNRVGAFDLVATNDEGSVPKEPETKKDLDARIAECERQLKQLHEKAAELEQQLRQLKELSITLKEKQEKKP